MTDRQFQPSQRIRIKLSGGRIAEATIRAVVDDTDGLRLQVDFGHDQTARVELWQVLDE